MNENIGDVTGSQEQEIVTFNVGGLRFETLRSTFEGNARCHLGNEEFLQKFYIKDRAEYFFDRDPDMFKALLNYLRTGELHLPSYICGPAAKYELEFWGIQQNKIEQCCWINYNEWNSTQEALKRLEHDRKLNLQTHDLSHDPNVTCWAKWRPAVWRFLNRSNSSLGAKIFGYLSLLFVVMSIFSFLAETTEPFEYYTTINVTLTPNATNTTTNSTIDATVLSNSTIDATVLSNSSNSSILANSSNSSDTSLENSVKQFRSKHPALQIIDLICLSYFVLEYFTRLVFSPKKFKYLTSLLAVIDFLAILPDIIESTVYNIKPELKENVEAVGYITIIRVIRVLRIFRLVRHSAGLWILIYTLRASFRELMLLIWFMLIGVLVFSSLIYYVDDKNTFQSIPTGFWWALITMTTVGYGDMYPVTTMGKLVGSLCAMAGVLMIGFTVPSLVNNFMLYYRHIQFAMHVDKTEKDMRKREEAELKENNGTNGKYDTNHSPNVSVKHMNNKHELYPLVDEHAI